MGEGAAGERGVGAGAWGSPASPKGLLDFFGVLDFLFSPVKPFSS